MPVAWDRLADAKQPQSGAKLQLAVITIGHVHSGDLTPLTPFFSRIEQLVLDIPPQDAIAKHRAEFNRAVDAATPDWVLLIREREAIDEALASEIAAAATAGKARGFRIRATVLYRGRPLLLEGESSEVRLFHRRYYLRYANKGAWDEIAVQGTVVRLSNELRSTTFATDEEHEAHLAKIAAKHSGLRRVLLFLRYALAAKKRDGNTLRYLWVEAGYDVPRAE